MLKERTIYISLLGIITLTAILYSRSDISLSNTYDDWRSGCKGIVSVLDKARKEGILTDVQFVVGGKTSKKVIHAHKTILACGSPVFEKMFYGALTKNSSFIETDDDPEAFEMLLNHIYGKSHLMTSMITAWKYLTIGQKYLVPNILDAAKEYVHALPLHENDFWDIIQNNISSSDLFLEKFNFYMIANTKKIIESKKFLNVPKIIVGRLLHMNELNVEEYPLLLAITRWAYKNKQADRKQLLKYYSDIRFSALTIDDFFQFIDYYPKAFDAQTKLEILHHLHSPSSHNLPKWCSTDKMSRSMAYEQRFMKINVFATKGFMLSIVTIIPIIGIIILIIAFQKF